MLPPRISACRLLLVLSHILTFLPGTALSDPQGIVTATIEWGPITKANYTFVFSGLVTREGRPCPNARVELDLETSADGILTESAMAGEDGQFELTISFNGSPEQSSAWKLQAFAGSLMNRESAGAEGRLILQEGRTTIEIKRSLFLMQA